MKNLTFLTLAIALSSCSMVPAYQRPTVAFDNSWQTTPTGVQPTNDIAAADWWTAFNSPELGALVTRALSQNNNVVAAAERITEARGTLRSAGASLLPSVSAGYTNSYNRADVGGHGTSSSSADVTAAYELDLFGANRAGRAAARAELEAAGFDKAAIDLTTAADVAQTYTDLLALRERRTLAEQSLASSAEILKLIETRLRVGTISLLEASQQRTAYAQSQSALASLKETEATTAHALAILVGVAPQNFSVSATSLATLTLPKVPLNPPSSLLERRPDLKVAEANLKAANADIGAARAAFFPTANLSAGLAQSFDPASTGLNLAASVLAPIFSGGAHAGALTSANARQREVAANYKQAILTAFAEASDALSTMESAETRLQSQTTAVQNADTTLQLTQLQLKAGTVDMPTLLNAQTTQLSAHDALIQARADALKAAVQIIRTTGGGVSAQ